MNGLTWQPLFWRKSASDYPWKTLSHLRAINYICLHSLFGELITFTFFISFTWISLQFIPGERTCLTLTFAISGSDSMGGFWRFDMAECQMGNVGKCVLKRRKNRAVVWKILTTGNRGFSIEGMWGGGLTGGFWCLLNAGLSILECKIVNVGVQDSQCWSAR